MCMFYIYRVAFVYSTNGVSVYVCTIVCAVVGSVHLVFLIVLYYYMHTFLVHTIFASTNFCVLYSLLFECCF